MEIESPYPMELNQKKGVTKKTEIIDRSDELKNYENLSFALKQK